jgi:hypothetical protein
MIRSLMSMITELSSKCDLPVNRICSVLAIPRASYGRWRNRTRLNKPLVSRPGPRKLQAVDLEAVNRDVAALVHGASRSEGVTSVYNRYRETISRRDFAGIVQAARMETNRDRRSHLRRIYWHCAGISWAIDDTEYLHPDFSGRKAVINHIQDLGSKYKLEPISGPYLACGEEIAGHLESLFHRYGAPLFLKRDNGGNLNHSAVNEVLAEHVVLPLNSPAYYPPYNGAIEAAQDELKTELTRQLSTTEYPNNLTVEPHVRAAVYELNHQRRECLNGKTPCQMYFGSRVYFNKQQRKEIYDWIKSRQDYIICGEKENVSPQVAWRLAAEVWLVKNRFITVSINNKVLPDFYQNLSYYL